MDSLNSWVSFEEQQKQKKNLTGGGTFANE